MGAGCLPQLVALAADGRLDEAIRLVASEVGATHLELTVAPGGVSGTPPTGQWTHLLERAGRVVGALHGSGPCDVERLAGLAPVLALAVTTRPSPLESLSSQLSSEAFWTLDMVTDTFLASEPLKAMAGLEGTQLHGVGDLLAPLDRADYTRRLAEAIAARSPSVEGVFHARTSTRLLRLRTLLAYDARGLVDRMTGTAVEVSPGEAAEDHAERRAEAAAQMASLMRGLLRAQTAAEVEALAMSAFSTLAPGQHTALLREVDGSFHLDVPTLELSWTLPEGCAGEVSGWLSGAHPALVLNVGDGTHPGCEAAMSRHGLGGAMAFKLEAGQSVFGAMLVVSSFPAAATAAQLTAGTQLAALIGLGLGRLATEARVVQSERQLARAAGLTRSGAWTYEASRERVVFSRELSELNGTGPCPQVLTTAEAEAAIHPEDLLEQRRLLERMLSTGGAATWTNRIRLASGAWQHRRNVAVAEKDPRTGQPFVSGVTTDVTAELEQQEKLTHALARARRYQTLFQLSGTLSAVIDRTGRFVDLSPTWSTAMGYGPGAIERKRVLRFIHPEDRRKALALALAGLGDGQPFTTVTRFRTAEGSFRYLSWNAVRDPDEPVLYAVAHDITTLTQTTHQLARSELRLRRAGSIAKVGEWDYDVSTEALIWGDELKRIHQVPLDYEPSFERWPSFFDPASRVDFSTALMGCLMDGEPFDIELGLLTASGARVWVRALGQAERSADRTVRITGVFQDITEQREAREALALASRAKSQFLANTSHEIRTPLNGILGMTQLALDTSLSREQREYLEAVHTSGENLLAIVNDILDISKIEAGRLELESVPFDLEQVVFHAARTQAARAHAKGLELIARVEPGLRAPVRGDPLRVGQVITNLLGNAVKFTVDGLVEVRARRGEGDRVEVVVSDTGVGIPADRLDAVFEAFTQADGGTNRRFGGTGLGLTITRELVHRMGGTIDVASRAGVGSTFTVTLPLPVAAGAAEHPAPARVERVLVVQRHPGARAATCALVETLGSVAVGCATGTEAMTALLDAYDGGTPFDTVLVEYDLGDTTGVELCEALHHHDGLDRTRRVLLVDTTHRPDRDATRAVGVAAVLTRPLFPSELKAVLGPPERSEQPARAPGAFPPRALRILLAEDNAINARLAVRLVEKLGHQVVHVGDGALAVESYQREQFDLVLMDMQMPRLDGLMATRRIRELEAEGGARVPIIALTANAMKGDDALCFEAGMDDYLTKPVVRARLQEVIERWAPSREDAERAAG